MEKSYGWIINTPEQCREHKKVCKKVKDFLVNVNSAGEESITDYLIWKWREIDKRFNSIKVSDFTRAEENKVTGADFEMELWLLGPAMSFSIVFQAKKIIETHNEYLRKIRYPDDTAGQFAKLRSYSSANNKIPMYAFYSIPDSTSRTICDGACKEECGVFIAHADRVSDVVGESKGTKISKNYLLGMSRPFYCLFCCSFEPSCLRELAMPFWETAGFDEAPEYINYIADCSDEAIDEDKFMKLAEGHDIGVFRHVAVCDMRYNKP